MVIDPRLTAALTQMAAFRQADVGADTLRLYGLALTQEELPVEVIGKACQTISRTPRREGETAFPDLGTLLKACSQAKQDLKDEERDRIIAAAPQHLFQPRHHELPPMTRDEAKAMIGHFKAAVEAKRRAR